MAGITVVRPRFNALAASRYERLEARTRTHDKDITACIAVMVDSEGKAATTKAGAGQTDAQVTRKQAKRKRCRQIYARLGGGGHGRKEQRVGEETDCEKGKERQGTTKPRSRAYADKIMLYVERYRKEGKGEEKRASDGCDTSEQAAACQHRTRTLGRHQKGLKRREGKQDADGEEEKRSVTVT